MMGVEVAKMQLPLDPAYFDTSSMGSVAKALVCTVLVRKGKQRRETTVTLRLHEFFFESPYMANKSIPE